VMCMVSLLSRLGLPFKTSIFIVMTIPFRCAEGTKRHETGASNAASQNLLE